MRTPFIRIIFITLAIGRITANAQGVLDDYITQALESNLALQQKNISQEKALLSLKIAKGMFMPSVGVLGAYTSGDGGRAISIPVGDLMNPVYSALNQLTESNAFPQIENVNENFFPKNFYDVKLRTSVPIINSDLIYNQKIRQQQLVMEEFEVAAYKRELVKEIKTAYYSYLSANEAISIYESALERALEGQRVNESLLANGKGLPAYVLRAKSEVENIKAKLVASEKQTENAKTYFNFLLNRDRETSIDTDEQPGLPGLESALSETGDQREELKQIQESISLSENMIRMTQLNWTPKLSGFLDLGSQYQDWEFNSQSKYYLFGVQLEVPLFAGFTNRNKLKQSQLNLQSARINNSLLSRKIEMTSSVARNNLVSAYQDHKSAATQLHAAQSYQRLIDKGYQEGVNSFIETVDARSQLTAAQLQFNISLYQALIAHAQYERELATYQFTN